MEREKILENEIWQFISNAKDSKSFHEIAQQFDSEYSLYEINASLTFLMRHGKIELKPFPLDSINAAGKTSTQYYSLKRKKD